MLFNLFMLNNLDPTERDMHMEMDPFALENIRNSVLNVCQTVLC